MTNFKQNNIRRCHLGISEASPWVKRFAPLVSKNGPSKGEILDLAAGSGRHAKYFYNLGHPVTAIDQDISALIDLANNNWVQVIAADLEIGKKILPGRTFAGIVVVNYLFRPLMNTIINMLEPSGVLIYETFARGNEEFISPRNPDHLLKSGELLELANNRLQIVAYEHGIIKAVDIEGVKQRMCAVNNLSNSVRDDGEPTAQALAS